MLVVRNVKLNKQESGISGKKLQPDFSNKI